VSSPPQKWTQSINSINQSHVVNDDDARSTGANARAVRGVFIVVFIVVVVLVVAIERGNPAG
jgi:hypothetical protein